MADNLSKNPETAIAELRKLYTDKMREEYERAAAKLKSERDEALRENWILQQRAKAGLSEKLSAMGINGGATEGAILETEANHQNSRNEIEGDYIKELGELGFEHTKALSESEQDYNEKWLEYLMSLSKMDREYEHKKYL